MLDTLFYPKDHLELLDLFKQGLLEVLAILLRTCRTTIPQLAQLTGKLLVDDGKFISQLSFCLGTFPQSLLNTPSLILLTAIKSVVDLRKRDFLPIRKAKVGLCVPSQLPDHALNALLRLLVPFIGFLRVFLRLLIGFHFFTTAIFLSRVLIIRGIILRRF